MSTRRIRQLGITFAAAALLASGAAHAAGDAARGETKSEACKACHGANGISENPTFPSLAGQYASYLVHALEGYADGTRRNAIMQGFAATLSAEDRRDLAAWYASQEGLQVLQGQR